MTTERNEPCPCGSGKKYKKCCGVTAHPGKEELIQTNRAIAYSGAIGWQREQFCFSYAAQKKDNIGRLEDKTRQELASQGKTISCAKGCWSCCTLFIEASLQECEAIVQYLYRHEDALQHFLRRYETWRERVAKIERSFRKMIELRGKVSAGRASREEQQTFDTAGAAYRRENLPCPFLKDNACSIYEIRPYVCAGHVSITPPAWCESTHPFYGQAECCGLSLRMENDMAYFIPTSDFTLFNLPQMVFQILEQGYDFLSTLPGIQGLKEKVMNEPAVVVKLASMKVAKSGKYS
jgi:Fe-S-cluster containining protein